MLEANRRKISEGLFQGLQTLHFLVRGYNILNCGLRISGFSLRDRDSPGGLGRMKIRRDRMT
jgi:hypothetical protein